MSDGIKRRDFLKVLGVSGAGAGLVGCSTENVERLIPYVVPPEDITPGVATWYTTVCRECSAGCGMWVRTREGRAVKVEGNPNHPVSGGALCSRGHASLQGLYNPDRFTGPMIREGGELVRTTWDEAEARLAQEIQGAAGNSLFVTGLEGPSMSDLIDQFLAALGGERVEHHGLSQASLREAARIAFGTDVVPHFDFERARFLVSFGADFLETWLSPVEFGRGFARMHGVGGEGGKGEFVVVAPRLDLTGQNADEWVPIAPGSEAGVALAMAGVIAANGGGGAGPFQGVLDDFTPEDAAEAAGIEVADIEELASRFMDNGPSLAVGPGIAGTHRNATAANLAVMILNSVAGNVGTTLHLQAANTGASSRPYTDMATAIRRMASGEVGVVMVHGTNPAYTLPAASGFSDAFRDVGFKVSFASEMNETSALADLVLPDRHFLESWGDSSPRPGLYALQQPVMRPVPTFEPKQTGDVLLSVAQRMGSDLGAATFYDHLRQRWGTIQGAGATVVAAARAPGAESPVSATAGEADAGGVPGGDDAPSAGGGEAAPGAPDSGQAASGQAASGQPSGQAASGEGEAPSAADAAGSAALIQEAGGGFEGFWRAALRRGAVQVDMGGGGGASTLRAPDAALSFDPPALDGEGLEFSLIVYPSARFGDGTQANRPWLLELPDPVSKITWQSWVEIHPAAAERLGVRNGDEVRVGSPQGEVVAPVWIYPGIREDVVAIAMGLGRRGLYGRFAGENGVNPLDLLPAVAEQPSGALSHLVTRVSVEPTGTRRKLATVEGADTQHDRNVAPAVALSTLGSGAAEGGVAPAGEDDEHAEPEGGHGQLKELQEGGGFVPVPLDGAAADFPLPGSRYGNYEDWEESPRWGMAIDLDKCTGCSACVTACQAENNVPWVGEEQVVMGRELHWMRIERYYEQVDASHAGTLDVRHLPMLCQHCNNAPCEPVCPVFAAYHTDDGLNGQVYNRCVGTRYCANNCPYKVRVFNWYSYTDDIPEPMNWQFNPDVTVRENGVMEKCTFCVQRIREAQNRAALEGGRGVPDGEVVTACEQSCPAEAIVFGNVRDPNSRVARAIHESRTYRVLDELINTQPAVHYQKKVTHHAVTDGGH